MTLHARKTEDGKKIIVGATYGTISVDVTEATGHLRGFHNQLGMLLDEVEDAQGSLEPGPHRTGALPVLGKHHDPASRNP